MKKIDLRSDTVTKPTRAMLEAMVNAELGDDVYEDDPTIKELESSAARLMGKEGALFVTSGTMGNLLGIWANTQRGDEIILGANSHIITHEVGGVAQICQVMTRTIYNEYDFIYPADIKNSIRVDDIHEPKTTLLAMENPLSNGKVLPLEIMQDNYKMAKRLGLRVHLDGARIFNAALALNVDVKEIASCTDTLMFCVSKGLCSPIGSVIVGDKAFIQKARKYRKMIGGGLRQVGVLGASAIISINEMPKRLIEDHKNAKYLAQQLSEIVGLEVAMERCEINMVFFKLKNKAVDFDEYLKRHNIIINGIANDEYRMVTHYGINRADIDAVIKVCKAYFD